MKSLLWGSIAAICATAAVIAFLVAVRNRDYGQQSSALVTRERSIVSLLESRDEIPPLPWVVFGVIATGSAAVALRRARRVAPFEGSGA
jgi:hypothetical protein